MGFETIVQPKDSQQVGIHPLAIGVGVVALLCLIVLVSSTSYQREKMRYMAQKILRKKHSSKSMDSGVGVATAVGKLPAFAKIAAEKGNLRILKRWVQSTNNDINARSEENMSALHYASMGGYVDCIRLLLENGADANAEDERRITPLHLVAVGGHGLAAKVLLDHHADPFFEDLDLQTPLHIAEKSGNFGCARLLQRAMAKSNVADSDGGDSNLTLRSVNNV